MFKREKESPVATGWNGGSTSDRTAVHVQIALGIPTVIANINILWKWGPETRDERILQQQMRVFVDGCDTK